MPAIINTYNTELTQRVIDTIKTCYDPEIPVDVWELGLIYEINIDQENNLVVKMTLTSPSCPVAETLPPEIEDKLTMSTLTANAASPCSPHRAMTIR